MRAYRNQSGVTVVELLVVIVIIVLLATLTVFSISAWRERTAETEVKNDLLNAAAAMEDYKNFNSGYPATLPSSFTAGKNVTVTLASSTPTTYCIQAQSTVITTVVYNIKSDDPTPRTTAC